MSIRFGNGLIIDEDKVALKNKNDESNIFNIGVSTSPSGLLNISKDNESLLSLDSDSIILHKNFQRINTSPNDVVLLEGSDSNNGTLYVGGYVSIGTTSYTSGNSLYAVSNIRTDTDIVCENTRAKNVYVDKLRQTGSDEANGGNQVGNEIQFTSNAVDGYKMQLIAKTINLKADNINLDATTTTIEGFTLSGETLSDFTINDSTASKLTVKNTATGDPPESGTSLLIQHNVADNTDTFSPLLIKSQIGFSTTETTYKEVLKISKEGHMLIGVNMPTSNTDYIIRGRISSTYEANYNGFLHFSSYDDTDSAETEKFVIDKTGNIYISGNVGIGTTSSLHSLDVRGSAMILGNIGIGTDVPTATKLDVNGKINISDSATFGSNINTDSLTVINKSEFQGTLSANNITIVGNVGIGTTDISKAFLVCKNVFIGEGTNNNNDINGGSYYKQGSGSAGTGTDTVIISLDDYANSNVDYCAGTMYIQVILSNTNKIANISLSFIYHTSGVSKSISISNQVIHKEPHLDWDIPTQHVITIETVNSSSIRVTISNADGFRMFWTVIGGILYPQQII